MLILALLAAPALQTGTPVGRPARTQSGAQGLAALTCGNWEPSFQHQLTGFPPLLPRFNAVHVAVIPKGPHRGKIMTWDVRADSTFPEWQQRWAIVDPAAPGGPVFSNYELSMPTGAGDLFCAGLTWTSEGDLLVVGGTSQYPSAIATSPNVPRRLHPSGPGAYIGGKLAYLWDPADMGSGNDGWHRQPNMAIDRWYPTAVRRADGSLIVAGGITSTEETIEDGNHYEVFVPTGTNPATGEWQIEGGSQLFPGPDNYFSTFYIYPRLYTLLTGEVFLAGMSSYAVKLDHDNAPGVWVDGEKSFFGLRIYETTVLMPFVPDVLGNYQDEVLILGGIGLDFPTTGSRTKPSSSNNATHRGSVIQGPFRTHGAVKTVEVSNPSSADPSWRAVASMHFARKYANGVLLPNGDLFVVGGNSGAGNDQGVVLSPEIYDGTSWTLGPPQDSARTYHSTAVLLPDGRVLSAGGNTATRDYQIYVPAYLCGGAPRPVITSAPTTMGYYTETPAVHTIGFTPMPAGHSVARAILLSPCAVTHHTDFNQRYVQLIVDSSASDHLDVRAPKDRNLAPPGYYMLFLLSAAGVPSEAGWVKLE